jgi:hypothetical protein
MRHDIFSLLIGALGLLFGAGVQAAGETTFPADWASWTSVSTPLAQIGALPGCDADVSSLPPIYQETVEVYCGVRPEGPGAVAVLVKPAQVNSYKAKDGKMADGPAMILHLKDMQLLFVTGYQSGAPMYSVFKEDGTDITAADPASPVSATTCRTCHTGYEAFCTNGQCASAK